jgi:hypothetical protein
MKTFIAGFILLALSASQACADSLFIEAGPGIFKSEDSIAVLMRYQRNTSRLFNRPSYYEAIAAYWSSDSRDKAIGLARGVAWSREQKSRFLSASFGLLGVSRTTDHLGTRFQFYFRFAYNSRIVNRDFSAGLIHISNGKMIFGWDGPNSGENFITFSLGLF